MQQFRWSLITVVILVCLIVSCAPAATPAQPTTQANPPSAEPEVAEANTVAVASEPSAVPATSEPSAHHFTIATINKMSGIAWFTRTQEGVTEFGDAHPNTTVFIQAPPQVDAALQSQMLEDMIAQKVNAIVVTPYQPEPIEPVLKKAMEQGIVVVTEEAPNIQNANYDIEAFDNVSYGEHLMQEMAKRMDYEGKYVVFVASLTSETHKVWMDSAIAYQKANYPNMTWVGDVVESHDDAKKAYEKMKEIMKKYPDLKGMQGSSAYDIVGAGQAVEEAGMIGKIAVVGTSLPSMAGNLIESGAVSLAACWDPKYSGEVRNLIALMILEGKNDAIKDGLNLEIPGYESIKVVGKVIYGSAWLDFTKDNYKDYNF